ncbi:hypothetical protein [Fodinibius halophilus]|uniref:Uncharacterized protein n=1 Tax=Fodinibius halophilus TaxID=1736908 RepID=A0A6M1STY3_9BACT|nr:hypothetical protein [Fodinibius halophilus]NGP87398.1 hypothetical protein [Fodinibius halophilus]
MISKLISQSANGKEAASQTSESNADGGKTASPKMFKSLLQSLQSNGSGGKKQNLLSVAANGDSSKRNSKQTGVRHILGGSFSTVNTESGPADKAQLLKGGPIITATEKQVPGSGQKVESSGSENTPEGGQGQQVVLDSDGKATAEAKTDSENAQHTGDKAKINNENTQNTEGKAQKADSNKKVSEPVSELKEIAENNKEKTTDSSKAENTTTNKELTSAGSEKGESQSSTTDSAKNRVQQLGSDTGKTVAAGSSTESSSSKETAEKKSAKVLPNKGGDTQTSQEVSDTGKSKLKQARASTKQNATTKEVETRAEAKQVDSEAEASKSKEASGENKAASNRTSVKAEGKVASDIKPQKGTETKTNNSQPVPQNNDSDEAGKSPKTVTTAAEKSDANRIATNDTATFKNDGGQKNAKVVESNIGLTKQQEKSTGENGKVVNEQVPKNTKEESSVAGKEQNLKTAQKTPLGQDQNIKTAQKASMGQDQNSPKSKKESTATGQEPKQAAESGNKDNKVQLTEKQRKLINNFFQQNTAGGISEKGFEMKSMQVEKMSKKDKSGSKNLKNERLPDPGSTMRMGMGRMGSSAAADAPSAVTDPSTVSSTDSSFSFDSQQIMWEEQKSGKSVGGKEDEEGSKKAANTATMRLNQMPIANASLRKNIVSGLTKSVMKAASEAKKTPQQWQKHNFMLDDGKKIQLSVRESKGVLQVRMGSLNMDLSKLLQQNLQQIREHLKQEFGTEIDLQFESNEGENSSEFSGDSSSSNNKKGYQNNFSNNELTSEKAEQVTLNSVRNFGYNKMEWTA